MRRPAALQRALRTGFHWAIGLACLLAVVAMLRAADSPRALLSRAARVEGWERYVNPAHRVGRTDAPVQIVVFSDIECPACRMLDSSLRSIAI